MMGNEGVLPLKKEYVDNLLKGSASAPQQPPKPANPSGMLDDVPETGGVRVVPSLPKGGTGLLDQ